MKQETVREVLQSSAAEISAARIIGLFGYLDITKEDGEWDDFGIEDLGVKAVNVIEAFTIPKGSEKYLRIVLNEQEEHKGLFYQRVNDQNLIEIG